MNTGTLCPLMNQREYTPNEKIVLEYFFTNIDKNVYCAKDAMPNQVRAFLVGQYSRSHLSMRDRFLQIFQQQKTAFEEGKIAEEDYVSLDELAETISKGNNLKLDYFYKKSSEFLKKWGVDYGHNSLKDADKIRVVMEGVSEVFTKIIEAPFPALGDFQEKSTRYLPFGKENVIIAPEILSSPYKDEILKLIYRLMDLYEQALPMVKKALVDNKIFKIEDFSSETVFEKTLTAKAFDIVRYCLPAGIATSLGAGFSTRTMETHLSYMLSHPSEEARTIAKAIHHEALKLSPGLLSHVGINDFEVNRINKGLEFINKNINNFPQSKVYKGITDEERINVIFEEDLDLHILSSILFESSRAVGLSYKQCMDAVQNMSYEQREKLMETGLGDRGKFDRMPRPLQHGTIMIEILADFGAYRDFQRHRATKQIWQGASCIHGYDYPEYIDLPGLEEFKKMYDEVMMEITLLGQKIAKDAPYMLEYISALGHLIRSTYEMDPGQIAYIIELRTTPQGHQSYRRIFLKLYEMISKKAPIFAKYIRVGTNQESSRKEQEEKAEQKRKNLM